jgi:hypothetical protein
MLASGQADLVFVLDLDGHVLTVQAVEGGLGLPFDFQHLRFGRICIDDQVCRQDVVLAIQGPDVGMVHRLDLVHGQEPSLHLVDVDLIRGTLEEEGQGLPQIPQDVVDHIEGNEDRQ